MKILLDKNFFKPSYVYIAGKFGGKRFTNICDKGCHIPYITLDKKLA